MSDPPYAPPSASTCSTAETSEGAQELQRRDDTGTDELGREVGAVLRVHGLTLDPTRSTSTVATTRR